MIEITQEFNMVDTNFIDATEEAFLEAQEEYELARINDLYMEATILFDAYTTGSLVLEDVKIGATNKPIEQKLIKGNMNRLTNYFGKIIKFLKGLINNFLENISDIFKTDVEWLQTNMQYLDKMPKEVINTLTLSCIPYWQNNNGKGHELFMTDKLPYTAKYAGSEVNGIIDTITKIKDQAKHEENEIYKEFFDPLYKLNSENVKQGAFLYYRGSQTSTKFSGNDAVKVINIMKVFIMDSPKYQNMLKAANNRVSKQMENLEKELEQHQSKGKELGTGQENLPTMGKDGKIVNPPGSTKAVEDSYFFEFEGKSLYSDIEGKSLFVSDFCNMMVDDYGREITIERSILPNSLRRAFAKNKRENHITANEGKETYRRAIKIVDQLIKADPKLSKMNRASSCDPNKEEKRFSSKDRRQYELYVLPHKIYIGAHGTIDKSIEEAAKNIAMNATKQLGNSNFYIAAFINWDSDPTTGADVDCIEFTLYENEYLDKDSDLIEFIGYESYRNVAVEAAAVAQPAGGQNNQNPNPNQQQNQQQSKPEMDPIQHQENKVINQQRQENSIQQTGTNACIQFCKMCGTVHSVCLSVYREIISHYIGTLKQVISAVKEYQGVKDEETENKNYNEQQRKNKDRMAEDLVADNIQRRRIRNANKGAIRRVWSNLFGG